MKGESQLKLQCNGLHIREETIDNQVNATGGLNNNSQPQELVKNGPKQASEEAGRTRREGEATVENEESSSYCTVTNQNESSHNQDHFGLMRIASQSMSFGNPNIGQQDNHASQLMAAACLQGKSSEDINSHGGRWTQEEHKKFIKGLKIFGKDWIQIQNYIGTRTSAQTRSHAQKFFGKLQRKKKFKELLIFNRLLVKKKKKNKRGKNGKGQPQAVPEDEIDSDDLYGLEDHELESIENAAKQLEDEFGDKRISHTGVWTKPEKKGEKAAKTKVIFKNYGTKVVQNVPTKLEEKPLLAAPQTPRNEIFVIEKRNENSFQMKDTSNLSRSRYDGNVSADRISVDSNNQGMFTSQNQQYFNVNHAKKQHQSLAPDSEGSMYMHLLNNNSPNAMNDIGKNPHLIKRGDSEMSEVVGGGGSNCSAPEYERISFVTDKSGVSSSIRKIFEVVKVEPNERPKNINRMSPFSGGNLTANSFIGRHPHLSGGLFSASGGGGLRSSNGSGCQEIQNGQPPSLSTSRITEQIAMIDEEEYNEFLKFKQIRQHMSGNSNDSNFVMQVYAQMQQIKQQEQQQVPVVQVTPPEQQQPPQNNLQTSPVFTQVKSGENPNLAKVAELQAKTDELDQQLKLIQVQAMLKQNLSSTSSPQTAASSQKHFAKILASRVPESDSRQSSILLQEELKDEVYELSNNMHVKCSINQQQLSPKGQHHLQVSPKQQQQIYLSTDPGNSFQISYVNQDMMPPPHDQISNGRYPQGSNASNNNNERQRPTSVNLGQNNYGRDSSMQSQPSNKSISQFFREGTVATSGNINGGAGYNFGYVISKGSDNSQNRNMLQNGVNACTQNSDVNMLDPANRLNFAQPNISGGIQQLSGGAESQGSSNNGGSFIVSHNPNTLNIFPAKYLPDDPTLHYRSFVKDKLYRNSFIESEPRQQPMQVFVQVPQTSNNRNMSFQSLYPKPQQQQQHQQTQQSTLYGNNMYSTTQNGSQSKQTPPGHQNQGFQTFQRAPQGGVQQTQQPSSGGMQMSKVPTPYGMSQHQANPYFDLDNHSAGGKAGQQQQQLQQQSNMRIINRMAVGGTMGGVSDACGNNSSMLNMSGLSNGNSLGINHHQTFKDSYEVPTNSMNQFELPQPEFNRFDQQQHITQRGQVQGAQNSYQNILFATRQVNQKQQPDNQQYNGQQQQMLVMTPTFQGSYLQPNTQGSVSQPFSEYIQVNTGLVSDGNQCQFTHLQQPSYLQNQQQNHNYTDIPASNQEIIDPKTQQMSSSGGSGSSGAVSAGAGLGRLSFFKNILKWGGGSSDKSNGSKNTNR